jgi:hypothetical protein
MHDSDSELELTSTLAVEIVPLAGVSSHLDQVVRHTPIDWLQEGEAGQTSVCDQGLSNR